MTRIHNRRTATLGALAVGLLGAFSLSTTGCDTSPGGQEQTESAANGDGLEMVSSALGIAGGEAGLKASLANCKTGDILLARGPLSMGIYPPWGLSSNDFTHAGLFDKAKFDAGDVNCILTANANGVGYENIAHWANNQDAVAVYRVKNYSDAGAQQAIAFARSIIGKKYNITSTLNDNNAYYCSKLVYRAWNSAGISFDTFTVWGPNLTDGNFTLRYCSPNNLAQSGTVARFYPDVVGATCPGTSGQWKGCRGNGCAVCAEQLTAYPRYFQNHPNCVKNTTCAGKFYTCNSNCPAPTSADQ